MKLKLKMYAQILASIKKCLISVIIRLNEEIMIIQLNQERFFLQYMKFEKRKKLKEDPIRK